MDIFLRWADWDISESVSGILALVARRFGVLLEWDSRERLRLMAGGVALSPTADSVEGVAEEGPVTIDALDDFRCSLEAGFKADCVWVTLSGNGVAEDRAGGGDKLVSCGEDGSTALSIWPIMCSYIRELERFGGTNTSFSSDGPNLAR